MRQPLIQNDTLSHLAVHLGLYQRLKLSSVLSATADMPSQTIAANAFEAYVGALWTEHADRSKVVREWLDALWSPKVFPTLQDVWTARNAAIEGKNRKQLQSDKVVMEHARADPLSSKEL
jgi:dsRNA-specific ribonuclease